MQEQIVHRRTTCLDKNPGARFSLSTVYQAKHGASGGPDAGPRPPLWRHAAKVAGYYFLAVSLTAVLLARLLHLSDADLRVPMAYAGDGAVFETWCKAIVDQGWYLHNPNLGAPYGQSMEDYPMAETCNFLIVKFFALFTHDTQLVVNLFTLSTYVLTTLTALLVLRQFKISYPPALACSLLYSFLPYHFKRASCHHLLACYHIVPLSIMLALWLYGGRLPWSAKQDSAVDAVEGPPLGVRWIWATVICVLQASSGIYYAFFAAYFLAVAGVAASVRRRAVQPLLAAAVLIGLTTAVLLANLTPTFLYWQQHGKNDVAEREPREAELYGFKLTSLLLPIPGHRIGKAAELRSSYDQQTLNRNENTWSSQGILANIGFVVLLGLLLHRKPVPRLLEGLSVLNIFGVLFGTMGGLGMFFNLLITPQIRSQNRISIFLSFGCLACLAFLLQLGWDHWGTSRRRKLVMAGVLAAMVAVGLWDQHPRIWRPDYAGLKREWTQDADFVTKVEAALPPAAMVLQLPFVKFPEAPQVHQYDAAQGVRFSLHSNTLRWSCGAMAGREADQWQQHIAALPLADQLQAAVTAGFQGIQVNRKGYPDQGRELERQLREQLGVDPIVSENGVDSFFPLSPRLAALSAGQF